jgi:hypothetical protein
MYTSKIINDKDSGIYLQGQLTCIVPSEEAGLALNIKNFWLEKERKNYLNYEYQNNWMTAATEVKACVDAEHEAADYAPGDNKSGAHTVYCDLCRITWKYDTSD